MEGHNRIFRSPRTDALDYQRLDDEKRTFKRDMEQLQQIVTKLQLEKESLKKELAAIQEDYKTLIGIMERARKMVMLEEDEHTQKVKFQKEKNREIEKIEK
jgi:prespore-specific regulator